MKIRGRIIAISGNVVEVCIIRENTACGSCSTCPKKMGIRDVIKVAAVKGIQIGQEVVLSDNKTWLSKNKIAFGLIAFVVGIILTETISTIISLSAYRKEIDLLGGGLLTLMVLVILWTKRPRYLLRIDLMEGGETQL